MPFVQKPRLQFYTIKDFNRSRGRIRRDVDAFARKKGKKCRTPVPNAERI
jgi:hypothetical protein